jgi:hypothetical protein
VQTAAERTARAMDALIMNDEARMTNAEGSSNDRMTKRRDRAFRYSGFVIISSF